jgi:hypothetical protein
MAIVKLLRNLATFLFSSWTLQCEGVLSSEKESTRYLIALSVEIAMADALSPKAALAETCLGLQRALLDMAAQMGAAERRRADARDEVRALEAYVDGLVAKLAAVKNPGSSPPTKLKKSDVNSSSSRSSHHTLPAKRSRGGDS